MKKRVLLLVTLILSMSGYCYGGELKIGIVEVEHVIKNSKEILSVKGKIREKFNKLQKDLNERESELKKNVEEFKAQSALYSPEAKKEKEAELKKEEEKLVSTFKSYQEDIKKNEQAMVKGVIEKIGEIAKEKGYSLVIEKNSGFVIYAADDLNINDEMIEAIDNTKDVEKKEE